MRHTYVSLLYVHWDGQGELELEWRPKKERTDVGRPLFSWMDDIRMATGNNANDGYGYYKNKMYLLIYAYGVDFIIIYDDSNCYMSAAMCKLHVRLISSIYLSRVWFLYFHNYLIVFDLNAAFSVFHKYLTERFYRIS